MTFRHNGFLAATFSSKRVPLVLAGIGFARRLALTLLSQELAQLVRTVLTPPDPAGLLHSIHTHVTEWHAYTLEWEMGQVRFSLDGMEIMHTDVAPHGPLSLVIWIDNQYAALPPRGRLRYGTLAQP